MVTNLKSVEQEDCGLTVGYTRFDGPVLKQEEALSILSEAAQNTLQPTSFKPHAIFGTKVIIFHHSICNDIIEL